MAVTLISYPVEIVEGQVKNAFPGFKPIELGFQRTAGEDSVECVLVDPNDENIDLLGFSLFADFDVNNQAAVDVSIINDNNSQSVVLASQEVVNSRIEYQIKYREAGTSDSYSLIDQTPIIAVYSIKDFELDKILNDAEEPKIWNGYPNTIGFIHSNAEEVVSFRVLYDELDWQKNIVTANIIAASYGAYDSGLLLARIDSANEVFANVKITGTITLTLDVVVTSIPDPNTMNVNVSYLGQPFSGLTQDRFTIADDASGILTINGFSYNGNGDYTLNTLENITTGQIAVIFTPYTGLANY